MHLPVPRVALEEIRTRERLGLVRHPAVAEVEAVRDQPGVGARGGDRREHAVVLVALEAVRDQHHAGRGARRRVRVAQDRLAVRTVDLP